jgi:hypothetical protein
VDDPIPMIRVGDNIVELVRILQCTCDGFQLESWDRLVPPTVANVLFEKKRTSRTLTVGTGLSPSVSSLDCFFLGESSAQTGCENKSNKTSNMRIPCSHFPPKQSSQERTNITIVLD